jgi:hypothetical protein
MPDIVWPAFESSDKISAAPIEGTSRIGFWDAFYRGFRDQFGQRINPASFSTTGLADVFDIGVESYGARSL